MSLINLDNLKEELKRKMDLSENYEDITHYPQIRRFVGDKPVTIKDLDDLIEELRNLIIPLHELLNGGLSGESSLTMEDHLDVEEDPPKRTRLVSHSPESLGSWKKRLGKLKSQMLALDELTAVSIINRKLEKLNELVSLPDNVTDVNEV